MAKPGTAVTMQPRSIPSPAVPYDKSMFYLSVSPNITGNTVDYAMNIRVVPYRIINNVIETYEAGAYHEAVGQLAEKSQTDAALGRSLTKLLDVVQTLLTDRAA